MIKLFKKITLLFKKITLLLKKIIAPPFCLHCRIFLADYTVLCACCIKLIKNLPSIIIQTNGISVPIHAFSVYNEPLKPLILAKQKSDYTAFVQLANLIWQKSLFPSLDFDFIVPIPLHWTRYTRRGFNQSDVIAKQLSSLSGKPILNCAKRIKKTEFQVNVKSPELRKKNIKDAFRLTDKAINGKNKKLLIIDDLYTTGATIQEFVKVLTQIGPARVQVFVVCRAV